MLTSPDWYDESTRGCSHPDGVILAGSADPEDARKVELLDVRNCRRVKLPSLPHPVADCGILFDEDTNILTVTGGICYEHGDWQDCTYTFRLKELSEVGKWEQLDAQLQVQVLDPVLICDNK